MINVQASKRGNTGSIAHYLFSNFSLEVEICYPSTAFNDVREKIDRKFGILENDKPFFVIYGGSLTITFAGHEKRMVGIDAYTNSNKWIKKKLNFPVGIEFDLRLILDGDLNVDRISIQSDPRYFYDPSLKLLEITLSDRHGEIYYKITDVLIVGVSGGLVSSILISDLSVQFS